MTAARQTLPRASKGSWQAILAAALRLVGWLAVNVLVGFGLLALVAFTIGSFTIEGTMHHLANLASRYILADAARQHQFDAILLWSFGGGVVLVAFFRRNSLRHLLLKEFCDV